MGEIVFWFFLKRKKETADLDAEKEKKEREKKYESLEKKERLVGIFGVD